MARVQSILAACLCTAVVVVFFGWMSSSAWDVAISSQVKHAGHISKDGSPSDLKSDLKEPQSSPEKALAEVLRVGDSLAGDATSNETELTSTEPKRPEGAWPLMYCWSLIHFKDEEAGYEETLIKFQLQHRLSIFSCDGFDVLSAHKKYIGTMDGRDVFTWASPAKEVSKGHFLAISDGALQTTDSWLNTPTFHRAWDALMRSKRIWSYDFVAKVDADSVFFPDRLRPRVQAHIGHPMYFKNCPQEGQQLYGALEVFSVPALKMYQDRGEECKTKLPWQGWGEDFYMDACMAVIGVPALMDGNQVGDQMCTASPCSDPTKVAFHPFRDLGSWGRCFSTAIGKV